MQGGEGFDNPTPGLPLAPSGREGAPAARGDGTGASFGPHLSQPQQLATAARSARQAGEVAAPPSGTWQYDAAQGLQGNSWATSSTRIRIRGDPLPSPSSHALSESPPAAPGKDACALGVIPWVQKRKLLLLLPISALFQLKLPGLNVIRHYYKKITNYCVFFPGV